MRWLRINLFSFLSMLNRFQNVPGLGKETEKYLHRLDYLMCKFIIQIQCTNTILGRGKHRIGLLLLSQLVGFTDTTFSSLLIIERWTNSDLSLCGLQYRHSGNYCPLHLEHNRLRMTGFKWSAITHSINSFIVCSMECIESGGSHTKH